MRALPTRARRVGARSAGVYGGVFSCILLNRMAKKRTHYNIRRVSKGRMIAYCHARCDDADVTDDHGAVTCEVCCHYLDDTSVAHHGSPSSDWLWNGVVAGLIVLGVGIVALLIR